MAYKLLKHLNRDSVLFSLDDPSVPKELFGFENEKPDLNEFPLPLPSRKKEYPSYLKTSKGEWFGASTGLTFYNKDAARDEDKIMYFSAPRYLYDNDIKAIMPDENGGVWVLTQEGVAHIAMYEITAEEKAIMLQEETSKYVDRRGMVSERDLAEGRNFESRFHFNHSDNDGCFTSGYSIGEVLKYAVYKKEKGVDHPDTIKAKASATRAVEACLLLMHIPGRGNGFVARTYLCPDELPIPRGGLFFEKRNGKAYAVENNTTNELNCVGYEIDASAEVPERLAKLYKDAGYDGEGIVYKADTSSDEITLHFLQMLFAHRHLGCDDKELDELIISSAKGLMNHIIDNGYELIDFTGQPTTWAKWSERYFASDEGFVDAALNSAEVLMYHLITMEITGEQGKWRESYDHLVDIGYADLTEKHHDRLYGAGILDDFDPAEEIMYGDHMLAVASFWGLCTLEKDEKLLKKYRNGFKAWRTSLEKEHNPGYDLPFALSCPDEKIDFERLADWFYRFNTSRLAAGVNMKNRHDVAKIRMKKNYYQISALMTPDETFIAKYDRDPLEYKNEDSGGVHGVESCYVYTFAYWIGRYYGFFE